MCNVHYAQLTRHYFVEYAESLYRTPKKRPCFPQFICLQQKRRMNMRIQSVNNASRPEWKSKVSDERLKIYSGQVELEAGLANMQSIVDAASAK